MDACDVLIVGGGPAGSSCAWKLRDSGLDVALLDRARFPRNKVCGGWITPAVVDELQIDLADYAHGRVLQPITAFRTGCVAAESMHTDFGRTVSYGIRRCEFDAYLLGRSGVRMLPAAPLSTLERQGDRWIANSHIEARLVIGAGGHFCPVARLTGAKAAGEVAVVAQEAEFEMDSRQAASCQVRGDTPELYFCRDMKGYGWCFRKQNFLNIGLGRMDQHRLSSHVADFVSFLKSTGRIGFEIPAGFLGHAYLLYGPSTRQPSVDGVLLIGDAAGLAYAQSGEGILPAIESGLFAASCIAAARGDYRENTLLPYRTDLERRFGKAQKDWISSIGRRVPPRLVSLLARRLLGAPWFARDVILKRWFLHWDQLSHPAALAAATTIF